MNKWKQRDNKRNKRKVKSFPNLRDKSQQDTSTKRAIKQARRAKEAVWDNLETEGDDE
tara:strand:+ start:1894 stop:2067 length:174 start_codon:yes stop_codon:yes gene_type:complete